MIALCFLSLLWLVKAQDPNSCAQWPTCEICLQHNLCGWCAEPVIYEDGSPGVRCAGKPLDPSNPPPGFKKWTCPKDYQNKACFGYICDSNFQCVSSGAPGAGVPLEECRQKCVPPTYECNVKNWTCVKTTPGRGTDKPSCEQQCRDDLYVCGTDAKCTKATNGGGQPLADCETGCKPSNVTPVALVGDYRGLEISQGYIKGEWQAKFTEKTASIFRPGHSVWEQGQIQTFQSQLWINTDNGVRKGIYSLDYLPEVSVLTWALGGRGQTAPNDFDSAMKSQTVFVLAKCLNPQNCKFNIKQFLTEHFRNQIEKRQIRDPCSVYPDCQSCVDAPAYCGWCSIPVVYNGSIPGKNCAGVDKTVTPPFNCSGSFSIQSCSTTSGTGASTGASTGTDTSGGGSGSGSGSGSTGTTASTGTTGGQKLFTCDPTTDQCFETPTGEPKEACEQQCSAAPVIPPQLQNKHFRGLQIDNYYLEGEWTAKFTSKNVTVTDPTGKTRVGKVVSVAQFLTIIWTDGTKTQTLWQYQGGAAVDYFSWAWGVPNGKAPASFDESMTEKGASEYFFVTCPTGKSPTICAWKD